MCPLPPVTVALERAPKPSVLIQAKVAMAHHDQSSLGVATIGCDQSTRAVLSSTLTASNRFHCGGFFITATQALETIPGLAVRIVLVAPALPDICGIRCARELIARQPGLKTILLASLPESVLVAHAIAAGINGCLISPFGSGRCLETLRLVSFGIPTAPVGHAVTRPKPASARTHPTDREEHVMVLLDRGLLYKEISDRLGWTYALVKKLQHSAYHKLDAANRTEALNKWHQLKA